MRQKVRANGKVVRCDRCNRRMRRRSPDWFVLVSFSDNKIEKYHCPNCIQDWEKAEADRHAPAIGLVKDTSRGVVTLGPLGALDE